MVGRDWSSMGNPDPDLFRAGEPEAIGWFASLAPYPPERLELLIFHTLNYSFLLPLVVV